MNNANTVNLILIGIVALVLGAIGGYGVHALKHGHDSAGMIGMQSGHHHDGAEMGEGRDHMDDQGRMGDMNHMMDMAVESERAFLEGMIPHHQEAVDTAKEVIARGGTMPEIRTLVEAIVVAQEAEIADMKSWYEAWYGEAYQADGSYEPMMRELGSLSGAELDRVFLEDMIMHHMGAIMMARSVQPYIEHAEVEALTEAVVTTQSEEIQLMRRYLEDLQ